MEDVCKFIKRKREGLKVVCINTKKESNKRFEGKINQDLSGYRILSWKELSKLYSGRYKMSVG